MAVLPKRFNRYKLTIHPKKTVLLDFRSPDKRSDSGGEKHTFYFLGFTHYWGKSRNNKWVIKRKTAAKRVQRTMRSIWQWCPDHRHYALPEQHKILKSKLLGHYQYYGIIGNYELLDVVFKYTLKAWRHWLGRRTRNGYISRKDFKKKTKEVFHLPYSRIVHSI